MKKNFLAVLAIFVLLSVIVTGNTLSTIQPIFASSEQESEGEDESETTETGEGNDEGQQPENSNQNDETSDEQQQGSENDEVGESGVASQQSGACPAVAIGGPTYEDENGCLVPCPKGGEVDSVPEGCPLPTDEMATTDVPDTVPTQTPNVPNSENTGVGQPRPPYKINDPFTSFSSETPTTPNNVLQWWNTLFSEYYHPINRSQSSDVPNLPHDSSVSDIPDIAPTQTQNIPSSENTGIEQPIPTDKSDSLLGPRSSQLQRTPDSVLTQKPPDTVFSGPKTVPGGDVPLSNPVLVPGPNEEGAGRDPENPCIVYNPGCENFPYPIGQDEICRNGIDDDGDGKVDEAYPCSEVPGQSKPKPRTDDVLVPIPSDGLTPK